MEQIPTINGFNTQPPEGGWIIAVVDSATGIVVSTHSRLKAAGRRVTNGRIKIDVSTHSRLKAAGQEVQKGWERVIVSTHSRLKAAGGQGVVLRRRLR